MTNTWTDDLESDLSWRESELASIKRLAITNSDNSITNLALLRASWALLYAHFEGFTNFCWELLLDEIQNSGVKVNELEDCFQVLALEKGFARLRGNLDSKSLFEYFKEEHPNSLESQVLFHSDSRLNTDSNLWPNVYERECSKIELDCSKIDEGRARVKTLVARRNDIAHGKRMVIKNIDEYNKYEDTILSIMHDLAVQVVEIIDSQLYLKK